MLPSDFPGTLPRGHHIAPPPQPRQIFPNNVQGFTFYDNKLSHKFQFTTPSSSNGGGGGAARMGSLGALHGSRSPPPDIPPPPVPHVGGSGFVLNNKVQNQVWSPTKLGQSAKNARKISTQCLRARDFVQKQQLSEILQTSSALKSFCSTCSILEKY